MGKQRLLALEETQSILLSVMVRFDAFCRENGLEYYMIGGTLLGAIRHQGFIPWDDDIDVGMSRPMYERFLEISDRFDSRYETLNYRTEKHCDYVITRVFIPGTHIDNPSLRKAGIDHRLYFDIFPLDYAPDDKELQEKQRAKLMRLKMILSLVDFKVFNHRIDKILGRRILSFFLKPLRQGILRKTDRIMSRYTDTGFMVSMASQYDYHRQLFRKEIYGSPAEYRFEGHLFKGPEQPHAYLKQLYGEDYLELPPESKRRPGFDIYLEE